MPRPRDASANPHALLDIAGVLLHMSLCETALQVRGEALTEEEIWSLLSLAVEQLLEDICDGKRGCLGQLNHGELNVKLLKDISGCSFSISYQSGVLDQVGK